MTTKKIRSTQSARTDELTSAIRSIAGAIMPSDSGGGDDEIDALIERDPFAALCQLVSEAGGTMRFHGVPITEQELRGVAERHAFDRLLAAVAPPLAPEPQIEEHW